MGVTRVWALLVVGLAYLVGEQLWRVNQESPVGLPLLKPRPANFPRHPATLSPTMPLRAKTAVVSGSTGFFGSVLVEQLLEDEWDVVALHRKSSKLSLLENWQSKYKGKLVLREVDLLDKDSLLAAVPLNVSVFFHVASSMAAWAGDYDQLYNLNINGTKNVVDVSLNRNVQKIVLTAGLGTYWCSVQDQCQTLVSETSPKRSSKSWIGYISSKYHQEEVILEGITSQIMNLTAEGIEAGQWAVIMNPANMIGPYDRTSYGRLYKAVNRGEFPVITPAKHNFCSALNVAKAKSGVLGENYILGGRTESLESFTNHITAALGKDKPVVVPSILLFPFAVIGEILGNYVLHRDPEFTLDVWYLFLNYRTTVPLVDSSKATKALGYVSEFDFAEVVKQAALWSTQNQ